MAPSSATTAVGQAPAGLQWPLPARSIPVNSPAAVLVSCSLAVAAVLADAASGQARLGLIGLALMALALALTLTQAVWARVGRPWRASRLAARAGTAASLFVAMFLSSVGVMERMGPDVTESAVFAAGVAVMSVLLLVVLPLALAVFGWGVLQDRRLGGSVRVLPWALLLVAAIAAVAVAVTDGSRELWLQAAAVAAAGATLTGFSAGLSRAGSRWTSKPQADGRARAASRRGGGHYVRPVSYDEALADRVRALVNGPRVTEKRMFGGLAFLLDGHMALAASGQGGLLVRVDPADGERLVSETGAEPMVMRGRPMKGWLRLDSADVAAESALEAWVERGIQYAATLPPKL